MIADPSGELLSRPQSTGEKNSYKSDQTDLVKCPENYVVGHSAQGCHSESSFRRPKPGSLRGARSSECGRSREQMQAHD